ADEEVFLGYSVNRSRQMSNETAVLIDQEIKRIVESGYERAKQLLTEHIDELHMLAGALLEYETLSGDEIKKLLAGDGVDRGDEAKRPPVNIGRGGSAIPKSRRPGGWGDPAPQGA